VPFVLPGMQDVPFALLGMPDVPFALPGMQDVPFAVLGMQDVRTSTKEITCVCRHYGAFCRFILANELLARPLKLFNTKVTASAHTVDTTSSNGY